MIMKRHIIEQPRQLAAGFYKVAVVDTATQRVVWEQKDWGRNLILNNGIDGIALRSWAASFSVATAGTGVTPTSRSAPTAAASQSTTTVSVTGTGFTFDAGDVGNMIKWGTSEEARIVSFTNPTTVEVTPSQSVVSGAFTVYHTNQTDVDTFVKRTGTYLTGAPNCQTAYDALTGMAMLRRTFDFSVEVGTVSYTEVALGWDLSFADRCFSRILLPSAVPVNAGQQLRLVYELRITLAPTTPEAITAAVSGWPVLPSTSTTAQQQLQLFAIDSVSSAGNTVAGIRANEPSVAAHVWISPSAAALVAFDGTPADRSVNGSYIAATLSAYTPFSYTRDRTGVFPVGDANRTDFRSLGVGQQDGFAGYNPFANGCAFVVLFDENQAKANTQTLTLTFRSTWNRVLA